MALAEEIRPKGRVKSPDICLTIYRGLLGSVFFYTDYIGKFYHLSSRRAFETKDRDQEKYGT